MCEGPVPHKGLGLLVWVGRKLGYQEDGAVSLCRKNEQWKLINTNNAET
jgi:hypothetical protein